MIQAFEGGPDPRTSGACRSPCTCLCLLAGNCSRQTGHASPSHPWSSLLTRSGKHHLWLGTAPCLQPRINLSIARLNQWTPCLSYRMQLTRFKTSIQAYLAEFQATPLTGSAQRQSGRSTLHKWTRIWKMPWRSSRTEWTNVLSVDSASGTCSIRFIVWDFACTSWKCWHRFVSLLSQDESLLANPLNYNFNLF